MVSLSTYRAELHIHTLLSPCAEVEMIPPLIVEEAISRDIRLIAITDHNTCENAGAVMKAAEGTGLNVLPGMELQTREEVHNLCLFDRLEQAEAFHQWVKAGLPAMPNRPDFFGAQFVVDETGEFIRSEEQMLLISVEYSIDEAFQKVTELGGLFIPAHINRQQFGLIATLGLIPTEIPFDALEISRHMTQEQAYRKYPQASRYPLIRSGDVHRLDEFLGVNEFTLSSPTIAELKMAFHATDQRSLKIIH